MRSVLPSRWTRVVLYALLAGFAVWCFRLLSHDIAQIPVLAWERFVGVIAACGALSLLNYALRVVRWQIFLHRLGHHFSFVRSSLYYVAGFAFTLSPGKVGELARARYYQAHGVPIKAVTAAFFIERLLDLLAVLAMALLIVFHFLAGDGYLLLVGVTAVVVLGIAVALALMPWQYWGQHRITQKYPALGQITEMLLQARVLLSPKFLLWGLVLSFLAWGAEGVGLGVLLLPFDAVSIDWSVAAGIYALAVLAGAVSFLPGGLGGTEVVMATLLHQQGLGVGEALLVTLLCRLLTLWLAVLLGWLAVFILRMKKYAPF